MIMSDNSKNSADEIRVTFLCAALVKRNVVKRYKNIRRAGRWGRTCLMEFVERRSDLIPVVQLEMVEQSL